MSENILNHNDSQQEIYAHEAHPLPRARIRFGLLVALAGFIIFVTGARPGLFGLDRSPVVGFIQIAVMLIGILILCAGGLIAIRSLWCRQKLSITADIGMRLVSTGYVVVAFSGLADIFGVGTHPLPGVPYFGVWQARGMELGSAIIAIGFILMFPPFRKEPAKVISSPSP